MRDIRLTKRWKLFTDRGESNVTLIDRVFLIAMLMTQFGDFFGGENRGRIPIVIPA